MNPITTISFFRYNTLRHRWWAFRQMGLAGAPLEAVEGLRFSKMLGSGAGNGFSIRPDFGTYGLLAVWDSEAAARRFFGGHPLYQEFRKQCSAWWTIYMRAAKAHGEWDGRQPFPLAGAYDEQSLVAVITRATIYPRHLWRFWRFVPSVSRSMDDKAGRIFSIGIGELPLVQQATFSLWEDSRAMMAYAYHSKEHQEVIRRTRQLGWYKEELFARFHPYRAEGEWENGGTPLDGYLKE
ncbi:MAG: hypothetical protein J5I98_09400 [Phaeodactylibacter sp.]|nr:hypothetical protein [Phaeodactylibacter sp.]